MTFAKPAVQRWDTNLTNIATPSAGQVAAGFANTDPVPSNWLNRFLNIAGEWQAFLDERFAGSAAGELKIIKQIQSNNGTTDPGLDVLGGTGVGSRAVKAKGGNVSSVAIVGAVGCTDGEIDTQTNSNFPGTGVMGITKVTGLPAVLGANIATAGPGVWGTSANGAGVYGTGPVAFAGVLGAGNAAPINTLLGVAAGAGVGGYSGDNAGVFGLGSNVPGVKAQVATTPTRGALNLVAQTLPSAPVSGDIWNDSGQNQFRARDNGGVTRPVTPRAENLPATAITASPTNSFTFSASTTTTFGQTYAVGTAVRGQRVEMVFAIQVQANAAGVTFTASLEGLVGGTGNPAPIFSYTTTDAAAHTFVIRVVAAIGASGNGAIYAHQIESSTGGAYRAFSNTVTNGVGSAQTIVFTGTCSATNAANTMKIQEPIIWVY